MRPLAWDQEMGKCLRTWRDPCLGRAMTRPVQLLVHPQPKSLSRGPERAFSHSHKCLNLSVYFICQSRQLEGGYFAQ